MHTTIETPHFSLDIYTNNVRTHAILSENPGTWDHLVASVRQQVTLVEPSIEQMLKAALKASLKLSQPDGYSDYSEAAQ